jgi:hypothetical protein
MHILSGYGADHEVNFYGTWGPCTHCIQLLRSTDTASLQHELMAQLDIVQQAPLRLSGGYLFRTVPKLPTHLPRRSRPNLWKEASPHLFL